MMLPTTPLPNPHSIILFEFDFNIKFPLLRLLHYLSDLKSINLPEYIHRNDEEDNKSCERNSFYD